MNPQVNIEAGLHIYDGYPLHDEYYHQFTDEGTPDTSWGRRYDYNCHLPVYISGNAYFNGARPYGKEQLRYVDTESQVYFSLIERMVPIISAPIFMIICRGWNGDDFHIHVGNVL